MGKRLHAGFGFGRGAGALGKKNGIMEIFHTTPQYKRVQGRVQWSEPEASRLAGPRLVAVSGPTLPQDQVQHHQRGHRQADQEAGEAGEGKYHRDGFHSIPDDLPSNAQWNRLALERPTVPASKNNNPAMMGPDQWMIDADHSRQLR